MVNIVCMKWYQCNANACQTHPSYHIISLSFPSNFQRIHIFFIFSFLFFNLNSTVGILVIIEGFFIYFFFSKSPLSLKLKYQKCLMFPPNTENTPTLMKLLHVSTWTGELLDYCRVLFEKDSICDRPWQRRLFWSFIGSRRLLS